MEPHRSKGHSVPKTPTSAHPWIPAPPVPGHSQTAAASSVNRTGLPIWALPLIASPATVARLVEDAVLDGALPRAALTALTDDGADPAALAQALTQEDGVVLSRDRAFEDYLLACLGHDPARIGLIAALRAAGTGDGESDLLRLACAWEQAASMTRRNDSDRLLLSSHKLSSGHPAFSEPRRQTGDDIVWSAHHGNRAAMRRLARCLDHLAGPCTSNVKAARQAGLALAWRLIERSALHDRVLAGMEGDLLIPVIPALWPHSMTEWRSGWQDLDHARRKLSAEAVARLRPVLIELTELEMSRRPPSQSDIRRHGPIRGDVSMAAMVADHKTPMRRSLATAWDYYLACRGDIDAISRMAARHRHAMEQTRDLLAAETHAALAKGWDHLGQAIHDGGLVDAVEIDLLAPTVTFPQQQKPKDAPHREDARDKALIASSWKGSVKLDGIEAANLAIRAASMHLAPRVAPGTCHLPARARLTALQDAFGKTRQRFLAPDLLNYILACAGDQDAMRRLAQSLVELDAESGLHPNQSTDRIKRRLSYRDRAEAWEQMSRATAPSGADIIEILADMTGELDTMAARIIAGGATPSPQGMTWDWEVWHLREIKATADHAREMMADLANRTMSMAQAAGLIERAVHAADATDAAALHEAMSSGDGGACRAVLQVLRDVPGLGGYGEMDILSAAWDYTLACAGDTQAVDAMLAHAIEIATDNESRHRALAWLKMARLGAMPALARIEFPPAAIDRVTQEKHLAQAGLAQAGLATNLPRSGVIEQNQDNRPTLRVVERIGDTGTESGLSLEERFPNLLRHLPLLGAPDPDEVHGRLRAEFPWLGTANEEAARSAAVCSRAGRPSRLLQPVLLVGPSGAGKSRWARACAAAMDLPFATYAMGGSWSSMGLTGSERGWSNARPSFPAEAIERLACANPLLLIDEVGREAEGKHNGSGVDALLAMLDPETSCRYPDKFLLGAMDLSYVSWVLTANNTDGLPRALLDRVEVIPVELPSDRHFPMLFRRMAEELQAQMGLPATAMPDLSKAESKLHRAFLETRSTRGLRKALRAEISAMLWRPSAPRAIND